MSLFERWLTLWVALSILAGLVLGSLAPGLFGALAALEVASVNLVVAVLIRAMVYPMMIAVDLGSLTRNRKGPVPWKSPSRTAYPSIAELSKGGRLARAHGASARTRPAAFSSARRSAPVTRAMAATARRRAASTESADQRRPAVHVSPMAMAFPPSFGPVSPASGSRTDLRVSDGGQDAGGLSPIVPAANGAKIWFQDLGRAARERAKVRHVHLVHTHKCRDFHFHCHRHGRTQAAALRLQLAELVDDQKVRAGQTGLDPGRDGLDDATVKPAPFRHATQGLADPEPRTVGENAQIHIAGMPRWIRRLDPNGSGQSQSVSLEGADSLGEKVVYPAAPLHGDVGKSHPFSSP
jgi:hypothetical protein